MLRGGCDVECAIDIVETTRNEEYGSLGIRVGENWDLKNVNERTTLLYRMTTRSHIVNMAQVTET